MATFFEAAEEFTAWLAKHGWIDGVRKRIDDERYQIRFTPRKPQSIWSAINVERVRVLQAEGRMKAAGLKAHSFRQEKKSKIYSYEQKQTATLTPAEEARFRKAKGAWKFFEAQPRGYRQLVVYRIISVKRPETRERRLAALIDASRRQMRL